MTVVLIILILFGVPAALYAWRIARNALIGKAAGGIQERAAAQRARDRQSQSGGL